MASRDLGFAEWGSKDNNHTMDSLMAQSYSELSHEERNAILHDLHGVADEFAETTEILDDRLNELEDEIKRIADKPAYDMACSMSPDYVHHTSFRLMFLRAECFDAKRSAKKIVCHFRDKLAYFGRDLLGRDILLSDLTPVEAEFFRQGRLQPLLQRDRGGRLLLFVLRQLQQETIPMESRVSFVGGVRFDSILLLTFVICFFFPPL